MSLTSLRPPCSPSRIQDLRHPQAPSARFCNTDLRMGCYRRLLRHRRPRHRPHQHRPQIPRNHRALPIPNPLRHHLQMSNSPGRSQYQAAQSKVRRSPRSLLSRCHRQGAWKVFWRRRLLRPCRHSPRRALRHKHHLQVNPRVSRKGRALLMLREESPARFPRPQILSFSC